MVTLNIDGRELKAEKGQTILQVARENGIDIPTLCHHEAIEPYGACRLCIVEISKGKRTKIVTSTIHNLQAPYGSIASWWHKVGIEPNGACRLCIVEISKGKRTKIVTICR